MDSYTENLSSPTQPQKKARKSSPLGRPFFPPSTQLESHLPTERSTPFYMLLDPNTLDPVPYEQETNTQWMYLFDPLTQISTPMSSCLPLPAIINSSSLYDHKMDILQQGKAPESPLPINSTMFPSTSTLAPLQTSYSFAMESNFNQFDPHFQPQSPVSNPHDSPQQTQHSFEGSMQHWQSSSDASPTMQSVVGWSDVIPPSIQASSSRDTWDAALGSAQMCRFNAELELRYPIHLKSNHLSFKVDTSHFMDVKEAKCIILQYIHGDPLRQLKQHIANGEDRKYFVYDMDIPKNKCTTTSRILRIIKDRIPPPRKLFGISQPIRCLIAINYRVSTTDESVWGFATSPPFVVITHIDDAVQGLFGIGSMVYSIREEAELINFALANMALGTQDSIPTMLFQPSDMSFISSVARLILGPDVGSLAQIVATKQFSLLSKLSGWFGKIFIVLREPQIFEMWTKKMIHGFVLQSEAEAILRNRPEGTYMIRFSEDPSNAGNMILSFRANFDYEVKTYHEIIKVTRIGESKAKALKENEHRVSFTYAANNLFQSGVSYPSVFDLVERSTPLPLQRNEKITWAALPRQL
eukprot:TRINITY_DN316_c0_g1_i1.p1 TRINITY_DN316_c0_g1~~TRINITY_DN316_c0_g1_i1.p1  ORF type:complete len:582 (+),score=108.25 TRINITY_DN316_c0_g1_i1:195-1940(+)